MRVVNQEKPPVKGRGLNSIPVRFALMAGAFMALGALVQHWIFKTAGAALTAREITLIALTVLVPALITFLVANSLTRSIRALRRCTDAIVAGSYNDAVAVDCTCEVGELADSMRLMAERLHSNILRMNILAYADPVTGLPNRAVIDHVLGLVAEGFKAGSRSDALLFIDLDGFKRVNDTLGHEAGDELLRQASERIIREGLRLGVNDIENCTTAFGELTRVPPTKAVFARFAGDEFVALLPGMDSREQIQARATDILESLSRPFTVRGNDWRIGASIGIARLSVDTDDPRQLLGYADIAMYAAKESGRGQYRFFDAALMGTSIDDRQIQADLREAIESGELGLHYQPKLDAHTLELRGVEALARWQHPVMGVIPPQKFIRVAEQSGLMSMLGMMILRKAAQQARQWQQAGEPVPVAVNVSAVQFERPTLVAEILGVLEECGLPPTLLEIEITESMVMSDYPASAQRLAQLRKAGVSIAIDDFGTGYSNLSQLARLPHGVLKVDKSLIQAIGESSQAGTILSATVQGAHALGHKVVAEGVETPQQQAFISRIGCDEMQGNLFGHPMSADELRHWRRQWAGNAAVKAAQGRLEVVPTLLDSRR
jgi:two-component system CheB/CheR fusion protein